MFLIWWFLIAKNQKKCVWLNDFNLKPSNQRVNKCANSFDYFQKKIKIITCCMWVWHFFLMFNYLQIKLWITTFETITIFFLIKKIKRCGSCLQWEVCWTPTPTCRHMASRAPGVGAGHVTSVPAEATHPAAAGVAEWREQFPSSFLLIPSGNQQEFAV